MAARVVHGTLVASTKATVTLTVAWRSVQVDNRAATGDIFFTTTGVDPTVGGADCFVVPPGKSLTVPNAGYANKTCVVELISSATPAYSVTGF